MSDTILAGNIGSLFEIVKTLSVNLNHITSFTSFKLCCVISMAPIFTKIPAGLILNVGLKWNNLI